MVSAALITDALPDEAGLDNLHGFGVKTTGLEMFGRPARLRRRPGH